jgi:hypothetical protein
MKTTSLFVALMVSAFAAGFVLAEEKPTSDGTNATSTTSPAPIADEHLPSDQLKPLLGPTLDGLMAPLQNDPKMPRVEVEFLRVSLVAGLSKAGTPALKQIYQNAIVVCDSLTRSMDDRAAKKSINDQSWQETSLAARRNIMGHYTRQIQLEGAVEGTFGRSGKGAQAAEVSRKAIKRENSSGSPSLAGSWKRHDGNVNYTVKDDQTCVSTGKSGGSPRNGKWKIDEDGYFNVEWEGGRPAKIGKLSGDGMSISAPDSKGWIRVKP